MSDVATQLHARLVPSGQMPFSAVRHVVPTWLKAWLRRLRRDLASRITRRVAPGVEGAESIGALIAGRKAWLEATLPPEAAAYHYDLFTKDRQKGLARRLGLPVATDLIAYVPLGTALTFVKDTGLERFVIKPNSSRSSIGCHAFVRVDSRYLDVRTGRRLRFSDLEPLLRGEAIKGRDDVWLVEELLLPADGSIAMIADYKMYCFGGKVELIFYKRPLPGKREYLRHWYTRDWDHVTPGQKKYPPLTFAPVNGARLVAFAEAVSSQLCYPFIRLDLYDTSRGIVLGEFTPDPGGAYNFNVEWNPYLVGRYHEAAAAISEGVRSGRIIPLGAYSEPPLAAVAGVDGPVA